MNKLLLLFCEGQDEPPYIRRVLKVDGWKNHTDRNMVDYPKIIQDYLTQQLQKTTKALDALQGQEGNTFIWTRKNNFLPFYILKKDQSVILIFKVGGTSKYDDLRSCIFGFKMRISIEPTTTRPTLQIGFFYDVDKSITDRVEIFEGNMNGKQAVVPTQTYLPQFCTSLSNHTINNDNYYHLTPQTDGLAAIGLFVFHEQGVGALEEFLLSMMRLDEADKNNATLFDEAEKYIASYFDPNRPKNRPNITSLKLQAEKNKALIGIAGQLQRPGKTNSVIITDADYISNNKINNHPPSKAIIDFVTKLLA